MSTSDSNPYALAIPEDYARMVRVIVRASSPKGSTQALAHRERLFALVRLEHARHPAIFLYPLAAALLQIAGVL